MDVLFNCFVLGLTVGVPVWILMQYLRPRIGFRGMPVFAGGLASINIEPVVLHGRFVASVVNIAPVPDVAPMADVTDAADVADAADAADSTDSRQPAP